MRAVTEVTYCSKKSVRFMAFVSDRESFQDQLEEALSETHNLTGVRVEIGKTGLPHRSAKWVFIARPKTFQTPSGVDPAQVLQMMSVRKCVALEQLLGSVSANLCAGWKALTKNKSSKKKSEEGSGAADTQHGDNLPAGSSVGEILARHPYCKKAVDALHDDSNKEKITARLASLLYWMDQQNAPEGVVDVSKDRAPVCVDGTIPDTNGKKIYVRRANQKAVALNPYHALAVLGYIPEMHNLAACTPAVADAASKKAPPCTLVFACLLAISKTLPDGRAAAE